MATVHVGAMRGDEGFVRLVALKKAHEFLASDADARRAFVEEARVASRLHHSNVAPVLDVEATGDDVLLVLEYVEGASLAELIAELRVRGELLAPAVATRIVLDACAGLHAAHELKDDAGAPLGLVHRDVTPQNVLVGLDGVAKLTDFGVAKVLQSGGPKTASGMLKGKLGYMAPEYLLGEPIDARSDVFALGVVAWEAFAGKRLFKGENELATMHRATYEAAPPVSSIVSGLGDALDGPVARALAKAPAERYASARDLGRELEDAAERAGLLATHADVAELVRRLFGDRLEARRREIRRLAAARGAPTERERPPATEEAPRTAPSPPTATLAAQTTTLVSEGSAPRPRRNRPIGAIVAALAALAAVTAFAVLRRTTSEPTADAPRASTTSSEAPRVAPLAAPLDAPSASSAAVRVEALPSASAEPPRPPPPAPRAIATPERPPPPAATPRSLAAPNPYEHP